MWNWWNMPTIRTNLYVTWFHFYQFLPAPLFILPVSPIPPLIRLSSLQRTVLCSAPQPSNIERDHNFRGKDARTAKICPVILSLWWSGWPGRWWQAFEGQHAFVHHDSYSRLKRAWFECKYGYSTFEKASFDVTLCSSLKSAGEHLAWSAVQGAFRGRNLRYFWTLKRR